MATILLVTDGDGEVLNETIENIQEFRGQGRARYLARQWDTQSLSPDFDSALWTDYDGDTPYADYTVDELGVVTVTKIYEPGLGEIDQLTGEITYFHTDHLGTTRLVTDGLGQPQGQATFTAFGEKVEESLETRYGYVGSYGYEEYSGLGVNAGFISERLMHVGYRTYDPSLGRFLERDPIGIRGGLNVYEYVNSRPSVRIDPTGLFSIECGLIGAIVGAGAGALGGGVPGAFVWGIAGFIGGGWERGDTQRMIDAISGIRPPQPIQDYIDMIPESPRQQWEREQQPWHPQKDYPYGAPCFPGAGPH
ncbi:MAG: hypothetical protein HJJLKODD_01361 [Phycisphaerae bacterium]|nr:hypothetical protein [Phycisphaerae bacterium]